MRFPRINLFNRVFYSVFHFIFITRKDVFQGCAYFTDYRRKKTASVTYCIMLVLTFGSEVTVIRVA